MRDGQKDTAPQENLWRFDPNRLRPGDVVLERGHGLFSKVIMLADCGEFSHALLWLGGTDFLEAVSDGARVISFARVLVRDPADWIVLRLREPSVGSQAVWHARNMAHKLYDVIGAVSTKVSLRSEVNPTALFCSQLVATAYELAGVRLVEGVAPTRVTPNMLHKRSCLQIVTPIPLEELNLSDPEQAQEIKDLIERDNAYATSMMQREMQISQAAFQSIRPMYAGITVPDGYPVPCPPGNLSDAIALLQVIDLSVATRISARLTETLDQQGYFNLLDEGLAATIQGLMLDLGRIKVGIMSVAEVKRRLERLALGEAGRTDALDRHTGNADVCEEVLRHRDLTIFRKHLEMHRTYAVQFGLVVKQEQELLEICRQFLDQHDAA